MNQYSEDDELEFIQGLYNESSEQLNVVYKEQKQNRDDLLQEIANILLVYTIVDNVMSMGKSDRDKEYLRISGLIARLTKNQIKLTINVITDILTNTVKNTYKFYSYNAKLKDVRQIIDNSFKGKHFSKRIWDNEEEVARNLHKKVQDFLDGKINVNQIKKEIEKTFNVNAYNAKRLTETEISRCSNSAFKRFCKETGVEKIKYNAKLENTCDVCMDSHGKMYRFGEEPSLPRHPICHCFYEVVK